VFAAKHGMESSKHKKWTTQEQSDVVAAIKPVRSTGLWPPADDQSNARRLADRMVYVLAVALRLHKENKLRRLPKDLDRLNGKKHLFRDR
jgi:hypothetical protein